MKNKFARKKKLSSEMSLQITSLADVFVILLVFLLKSSASSVTTIGPTSKMLLPISDQTTPIKDSLQLEIIEDAILIDKKPVVKLSKFRMDPATEEASNAKILEALKAQRKPNPTISTDPHLLVLADQRVPNTTLQGIFKSAGQSGFVDLQLVVVKPE